MRAGAAACAAVLGVLAAPAPAGALGHQTFEHPPYFTGDPPDSGAAVVHLPVRFERDPARLGLDARMRGALDSLAADASRCLDSLRLTRALVIADSKGAPDVYGGCERGGMGPAPGDVLADECDPKGPRRFVISVSGPSRAWRQRVATAMREAGADAAIVVTLEFSQQWVRQKNLRGDKGIDLGNEHSVALPWLTGLDTPAEVLGLAGAVVNREGDVVRAGFEGLIAKRTGLAVGSFGAGEVLQTEDVERLRTETRRHDLPGEPLLWRAALESLVTQLRGPRAR
jgi:hypothetical protein